MRVRPALINFLYAGLLIEGDERGRGIIVVFCRPEIISNQLL